MSLLVFSHVRYQTLRFQPICLPTYLLIFFFAFNKLLLLYYDYYYYTRFS